MAVVAHGALGAHGVLGVQHLVQLFQIDGGPFKARHGQAAAHQRELAAFPLEQWLRLGRMRPGKRCHGTGGCSWLGRAQDIHFDRPIDILEAALAQGRGTNVGLVADGIVGLLGYADTTGLGQRMDTRGDVDAVADDLICGEDYVTDVNPDAQTQIGIIAQ